jgi:hypothetical protein
MNLTNVRVVEKNIFVIFALTWFRGNIIVKIASRIGSLLNALTVARK